MAASSSAGPPEMEAAGQTSVEVAVTYAELLRLKASVEAQAWEVNLDAFRWLVSQAETRPGVLKATCLSGHDLTLVGRLLVGVGEPDSDWDWLPGETQLWSWRGMPASLEERSLNAVALKSDVRFFGLVPCKGFDHARHRSAKCSGVELPLDASPWFFHLVRGNGDEVLFSLGEKPWTAVVVKKGRWSPGGRPLFLDEAALAAAGRGGGRPVPIPPAVPIPKGVSVPRWGPPAPQSVGRDPDPPPVATGRSPDAQQSCSADCQTAGCAACWALQFGRSSVPPGVEFKAAPAPAPAGVLRGPAPFKPAPQAPPQPREAVSAVAEPNASFAAMPRPAESEVPGPQFKTPPRPAPPLCGPDAAAAERKAPFKAPPPQFCPPPEPEAAVAERKEPFKAPPPPFRPPPEPEAAVAAPKATRLTMEEFLRLTLAERLVLGKERRPVGLFVKAFPGLRPPKPQPSVVESPEPQPLVAEPPKPQPSVVESPGTSDEEEISSQAQGLTPR